MTEGRLRVAGELTVPGDKSISHRSLICSALAEGTSRVRAILQSADVHSTAGVLRALGVDVPELGESITITGVGAVNRGGNEIGRCGPDQRRRQPDDPEIRPAVAPSTEESEFFRSKQLPG